MADMRLFFYSLLVVAANGEMETCNAGGSLIPILEDHYGNPLELVEPGNVFSIKLKMTNTCFKVEGGQHRDLPATLPKGTPLCIKIVDADGGGGLGDVLPNVQVRFRSGGIPSFSNFMDHPDDLSEYAAWCTGCVGKAACGIIKLDGDVELAENSFEILNLSIEADYITYDFYESKDPAGCSELRAYVQAMTSPTALEVAKSDGSCSGEVGGGQGSSSLRVSCPTGTSTSFTAITSTMSTSTTATSETSTSETTTTFSCHICCEEILHYFEITRVMAANMAISYSWEPLHTEPDSACLVHDPGDGSTTEGGSTSDGSEGDDLARAQIMGTTEGGSTSDGSTEEGGSAQIMGTAEGGDVALAQIMGFGFIWLILSVVASASVTLAIMTRCPLVNASVTLDLQRELVKCQVRLEQLESEEKTQQLRLERLERAKQIEVLPDCEVVVSVASERSRTRPEPLEAELSSL